MIHNLKLLAFVIIWFVTNILFSLFLMLLGVEELTSALVGGGAAILLSSLLLMLMTRKSLFELFHIRKPKMSTWRVLLPAFVITLWASIWVAAVIPHFSSPANDIMARIIGQQKVLFTFDAIVVAPIVEEIIFRGAVLAILVSFLPGWLAITLTAALFAALHLSITAFIPLFLVGMLLTLTKYYTGNLTNCIMLHSLNNIIASVSIWIH